MLKRSRSSNDNTAKKMKTDSLMDTLSLVLEEFFRESLMGSSGEPIMFYRKEKEIEAKSFAACGEELEKLLIRCKGLVFDEAFLEAFQPFLIILVNKIIKINNDYVLKVGISPLTIKDVYAFMNVVVSPFIGSDYEDGNEDENGKCFIKNFGVQKGCLGVSRQAGNHLLSSWDFKDPFADYDEKDEDEKEEDEKEEDDNDENKEKESPILFVDSNSVEMFCLSEVVEIMEKVSVKSLEWGKDVNSRTTGLNHESVFMEYECFFEKEPEKCILVIRKGNRKPLTEDFVTRLIPMLAAKNLSTFVFLGAKVPQSFLEENLEDEDEEIKWTVNDFEKSIYSIITLT